MSDERIGLVILTHRRPAEVCRSVRSALDLPEKPEIVVVDNASRDGTRQALRELGGGFRVVESDRNRGAAGRNLGVAALARPYLAFSDDDTWWAPGALARAADFLDDHPRVAVVTAGLRVEPAGRLDPTCEEMSASPLSRDDGPGVVGFLAGACVMRRDAFLSVGGYDERLFLGAEEALLALDLLARGWELRYLPTAVAFHRPSRNRDDGARRRLHARNVVWIAWRRRALRSAIWITVRELRDAAARGDLLGVLPPLARVLPSVLRERRVVPAPVECMLRCVERAG